MANQSCHLSVVFLHLQEGFPFHRDSVLAMNSGGSIPSPNAGKEGAGCVILVLERSPRVCLPGSFQLLKVA